MSEFQFSLAQSVGSSSLENLADLGEIPHRAENLILRVLTAMSTVLAAGHMSAHHLENLYAESVRATAGFEMMEAIAVAGRVAAAGNVVTELCNAEPILNLHSVDFLRPFQRKP